MITGTHHFTTRQAAMTYYAKQGVYNIQYKMDHGEIAIGKPDPFFHVLAPYRLGDVSCWPDRDGRYHIEIK